MSIFEEVSKVKEDHEALLLILKILGKIDPNDVPRVLQSAAIFFNVDIRNIKGN